MVSWSTRPASSGSQIDMPNSQSLHREKKGDQKVCSSTVFGLVGHRLEDHLPQTFDKARALLIGHPHHVLAIADLVTRRVGAGCVQVRLELREQHGHGDR